MVSSLSLSSKRLPGFGAQSFRFVTGLLLLLSLASCGGGGDPGTGAGGGGGGGGSGGASVPVAVGTGTVPDSGQTSCYYDATIDGFYNPTESPA